jgi:hypothetical protein
MPHHRPHTRSADFAHRRVSISLPLFAVVAALAAGCGGDGNGGGKDTSLVAAGDIAGCFWRGDEATARLLDRMDGVVMALGDNVYQSGTPAQYARCYGPTWGRHLDRTRSIAGNHDYRTREGAAYYAYFGTRAGPAGKGWYSYELDGWHVVALNSEEAMGEGSEQLEWLRADLAAHPTRCTLAAMHRPRFSTGDHGDSERVKAAFRALYEAGVDVVLSGHDHDYERFMPQDPEGRPDARGVRQFVVGTGGAPTYPMRRTRRTSEVRGNRARGVLRLVFRDDGYEWEFVPIQGERFTDSGRATCSPEVRDPRFTPAPAPDPAGVAKEAREDQEEEEEQ